MSVHVMMFNYQVFIRFSSKNKNTLNIHMYAFYSSVWVKLNPAFERDFS